MPYSPVYPACGNLLRAVFVAVALMSFAVSGSAAAQISKEYLIKAVFLWRLAQFTQWPSGAFETAESSIVICVFGENEIAGALAGRSVLAVGVTDGIDSSYDPMVRFMTEQNKIKLRINHGAVAAARLVFDPRLLQAAATIENGY